MPCWQQSVLIEESVKKGVSCKICVVYVCVCCVSEGITYLHPEQEQSEPQEQLEAEPEQLQEPPILIVVWGLLVKS